MSNKRKVYLIKPRMQIRVISWLVASAAVITSALAWITYSTLNNNEQVVYATAELMQNYENQLQTVLISLCALVLMSTAAMFFFGIYITQKIAGPLVPIERMISDLQKGNFDLEDINLRKGDELQELADKVNDLKNTLRAKQDPKTPS